MAEYKFFSESTHVLGKEAVKIGYWHEEKCSYAVIVPELGANLVEYVYRDMSIIFYDKEALQEGEFTGCPVLFPTPNRVRGCSFSFRGKDYPQKKGGKERFLHGLVYDEPFVACKPVVEDNCVWVEYSVEIKKGSEMYESFPFSCRLTLRFTVDEKGLFISYCVKNMGENDLPFGFAIHPYFYMPKELDRIIQIDSELFLEVDENILPSGKLLPVYEYFPDLAQGGVAVKELVCDNDFIMQKEGIVKVFMNDIGKVLTISATEDFRHCMVYRPCGADFICIENQTCSIDAHNLYSKGLQETSGLQIILGGQKFSGSVSFIIQ